MSETTEAKCARNGCLNVVETSGEKKYCSVRCGRNAATARRRMRQNVPLDEAVISTIDFTLKKVRRSAKYLAATYNAPKSEVLDLLMAELDDMAADYWDAT